MAEALNIGDVVTAPRRSRLMTVRRVTEDAMVLCDWFDDADEDQQGWFRAGDLARWVRADAQA
jgi:uncharacterized protein YodC (DUF2158 family)